MKIDKKTQGSCNENLNRDLGESQQTDSKTYMEIQNPRVVKTSKSRNG